MTSPSKTRLVALAAAVALAAGSAPALRAQTAAQPPAFRASTEVVEVDVVVQDKNGAFISDLTLDDFEVLEEGKPQRVQQLYLHAAGDAQKEASGPSKETPRVFIAVFEENYLSPATFKRMQDAAKALFTEQFADGDLGGVVVNGVMANSRLSRDWQELLAAVQNAKPTLTKVSRELQAREWPRVSEAEALKMMMGADAIVSQEVTRRACSEEPAQCRDLEADAEGEVQSKALQIAEEIQLHSTQTLQVLKNLMEGLQGIDGRKSVILMSEGFMTDPTWPLLKETEEASARANARIYTLDVRGADRPDPRGNQGGPGGQLLQQMDTASASMNPLGVDTGGFAVRSAAVFATAVKQISADAGSYYVLGYRPPVLDGQFHALTVRVKRPLAAVRARKGYVATATSAAAALAPISARPVEGVARAVEGIDTPGSMSGAGSTDSVPAVGAMADPNGTGVRARPDAAEHVAALQKNAPANAAAAAGWDAYSRGDFQSAQTSLSMASADPSARPWVLYALGHAQYALGDYARAIAAWERVANASPDFEPVYFDLADSYMQQEDFDRASRVVRAAADRWPQDGEAYLALGVIQAWRGTLDDAVQLFQKATSLSPNNAAARFNLGKALELRYYGSRRFDDQSKAWVANEADRNNATAAYKRCIEIGGTFVEDAREGLARLDAMTK